VERWVLTRELHDVVTHHLSTAALQVMSNFDAAGADELRSTLTKVDRSVRAALAELRQATRLQREDPIGCQVAGPGAGELSARVPPTTVGALWARRLTDAGFQVTLAVLPATDRLRMSVQATVNGALEVSCDNVLRHAPPRSSCSITVGFRPDQVVVRVANPLPSSASAVGESGRSLRRLRERVDLSGGTFRAGPSTLGKPQQSAATWLVVVAVPL
jgi:signal transduction histidine kinase